MYGHFFLYVKLRWGLTSPLFCIITAWNETGITQRPVVPELPADIWYRRYHKYVCISSHVAEETRSSPTKVVCEQKKGNSLQDDTWNTSTVKHRHAFWSTPLFEVFFLLSKTRRRRRGQQLKKLSLFFFSLCWERCKGCRCQMNMTSIMCVLTFDFGAAKCLFPACNKSIDMLTRTFVQIYKIIS